LQRRGSPWPHRGYSSRPSPPYAYAGASYDSLRGGGGGAQAPPPQYAQGPQFQPPPYGYSYGQPQVQPYGSVPYNYGHPQQQPLPSPQYAYGNPNQYAPQPHGAVRPNAGFQQQNTGFMPPNAGFQPPNAGFMPPNAGFRPWGPQPRLRLAEYKREFRYVQKLPPRQAGSISILKSQRLKFICL
jgi:hypothetical protein